MIFKRQFLNGRKTIAPIFLLLLLFSFSLFMGCTGSDTFIIQNTKLNKLFDANIVGQQGLIPFINFDGNALEVQSGFDFNSDTNTLRTGCVELGDGNYYCASTDFPSPDLSSLVPYTGATTDVDLGSNNLSISGEIDLGGIGVNKIASGSPSFATTNGLLFGDLTGSTGLTGLSETSGLSRKKGSCS
jgi:hypothetical protein